MTDHADARTDKHARGLPRHVSPAVSDRTGASVGAFSLASMQTRVDDLAVLEVRRQATTRWAVLRSVATGWAIVTGGLSVLLLLATIGVAIVDQSIVFPLLAAALGVGWVGVAPRVFVDGRHAAAQRRLREAERRVAHTPLIAGLPPARTRSHRKPLL